MHKITLADLVKPGSPILTPEALGLILAFYSELVGEVGRQRFEQAWLFVMRSSKFRPDISELREAAGARLKSRSELEHAEADQALMAVLKIIAFHGPKLHPIAGKVLQKCDSDGRILNRVDWVCEADTPAPELTPRIEHVIRLVGMGSFWAGIRRLATHPSVQGREDEPTHPVEAKRIEDRWHQAFRETAEVGYALA